MNVRPAALLPVVLITSACLQGICAPPPAAPPPNPTQPPPSKTPEVFSVPPVRPPQPSDIVAEVNGTPFTRHELDTELAIRFESLDRQIDPKHLAVARNRARREILQQFIIRTLLLQEAERAGIEVSADDQKKALDAWAARQAPGTNPEDVLHGSPLGPERMRRELTTGLTIEKLIASRMTGKLALTKERVDAFHRKNRTQYASPESVHARHILIAVAQEQDSETKADKRSEALEIHAKLLAGADFAAMSKQHSDCPSGSRGGDLGTFQRGRMVPPFDKAAFSQKVDEIGPVLETQFGYHIVQVLAHNYPKVLTREEARSMLAQSNKQLVLQQLIGELKKSAAIKPPGILERAPSLQPPPPIPGTSPPGGK
jgi:peptidyl-prolyl cis-trans isomerase C